MPNEDSASLNLNDLAGVGNVVVETEKPLMLAGQLFDDRGHAAAVSHHDAEQFELTRKV